MAGTKITVGSAHPERPFIPPSPTWLDRAITWLEPRRGFERMRYRTASAMAEYMTRGVVGGAAGNRLRIDWTGNTTTIDAALRLDREKIRNIVRDLILGNPYAKGAQNRITANVIGKGIKPQCRLAEDTAESEPMVKPAGWRPISEAEANRFQKQAEQLWAEFAESCDVEDDSDFYEQQGIIEDKLTEDGEILVHLPNLARRGRPISFGVELIEVDRLATPIGKINDPNIREGVEIDPATGQAIAYYLMDVHPGDTNLSAVTRFGKYTRIPRYNEDGTPRIMHLFHKRRPGQKRGYSAYTAALEQFEDLHRIWEAKIMQERVAACYAAFVESPAANVMQRNTGNVDSSGNRREKFEPGMIWYGMPGEKVTFGDPNRPGQSFAPFVEILLRAMGVCVDLPYELLALDFSKTNYSSARASLLEARRTFQRRQQYQVRKPGRPIWKMVITEGIVSGRLDAPGFAGRRWEYLDSFWTPPSWGWVDPVKEEQAARESIRGFLSTHADELAAQGRDVDTVFETAAREHKQLKKLGLPSPWDTVAPPKALTASGEDKSPAKKPAMDEDEMPADMEE